MLAGVLESIEAVANEVLAENGFSYTARAQLRREKFPTRVYESVVVESGSPQEIFDHPKEERTREFLSNFAISPLADEPMEAHREPVLV